MSVCIDTSIKFSIALCSRIRSLCIISGRSGAGYNNESISLQLFAKISLRCRLFSDNPQMINDYKPVMNASILFIVMNMLLLVDQNILI